MLLWDLVRIRLGDLRETYVLMWLQYIEVVAWNFASCDS